MNPIMIFDISGYSLHSPTECRLMIQKLQDFFNEIEISLGYSGKFEKEIPIVKQRTGDRYYILFMKHEAQTAFEYAKKLLKCSEHYHNNHSESDNLTINLRIVLGYGEVNTSSNQWDGEELVEIQRFLNNIRFKIYQKEMLSFDQHSIMALTEIFYNKVQNLHNDDHIKFTQHIINDKNGAEHKGYILDQGHWQNTTPHLEIHGSALKRMLEGVKENIERSRESLNNLELELSRHFPDSQWLLERRDQIHSGNQSHSPAKSSLKRINIYTQLPDAKKHKLNWWARHLYQGIREYFEEKGKIIETQESIYIMEHHSSKKPPESDEELAKEDSLFFVIGPVSASEAEYYIHSNSTQCIQLLPIPTGTHGSQPGAFLMSPSDHFAVKTGFEFLTKNKTTSKPLVIFGDSDANRTYLAHLKGCFKTRYPKKPITHLSQLLKRKKFSGDSFTGILLLGMHEDAKRLFEYINTKQTSWKDVEIVLTDGCAHLLEDWKKDWPHKSHILLQQKPNSKKEESELSVRNIGYDAIDLIAKGIAHSSPSNANDFIAGITGRLWPGKAQNYQYDEPKNELHDGSNGAAKWYLYKINSPEKGTLVYQSS